MDKPILMIAEKPTASKKLAYALADNDIKIDKHGKVTNYIIEHKKNKIIIAPSVGHLFTLSTSQKGYPITEYEWKPTYEKAAKYSKVYFNNFKRLNKKVGEIIIATDNDSEGSVLGWNIAHQIFGLKDGKRMTFSTLTKPDLRKAYETASEHLDFAQIEAGIARHELDFVYGLSLSKAAMTAISKAANRFKLLSIGRVQGPALAILAKRELEIREFKPVPYWQIFANFEELKAIHEQDRFLDKAAATRIYEKVKNKPAKVADIKSETKEFAPPVPFDLTTLQMEAWRCLHINPKRTLELAQTLYQEALISYPRTSSQKLPPSIGYKKILGKLALQNEYAGAIKHAKNAYPRQGSKTDPAHPAIYPTGELPKGLSEQEFKLYDLIVKRFIALFGEKSKREYTTIILNIEGEPFILKGSRTVFPGWMQAYWPYSKQKEIELPRFSLGQVLEQKTSLEAKETEPPSRYTPASIIKVLGSKNLGTKATRANIIDILYQRNYIEGSPIIVTSLGLKIVDTFNRYAPTILSEKLTAKFEEEMEAIRENKQTREKVLSEAKKVLVKICEDFNKNLLKIGKSLASALIETRNEQSIVGPCPNCKAGKMRVIRSKKTKKKFLACNNYPNCKTTWPLPQKGGLRVLKKKCKDCGTFLVAVIYKGKKPWQLCVNPNCPSKKEASATT